MRLQRLLYHICRTVVVTVLLLVAGELLAQTPAIVKMEYFIDTDPGYNRATNLSFTGTTNATASFNIDVAALNPGVHIVGVRSRDANGAWSLDNRWLFVKPYTTTATTIPNVNRVEWYIDQDPGYGNGTALPLTPAQDINGLSFNISLLPLAPGVHIVGVRSRDSRGAWSHDNKWLFVKPYSSAATLTPNINRVEWFIDRDPGYGNANAISITAAQNLSNLSFTINLAGLYTGVHVVGVRSRDANGAWSLDNKWIFLKPDSIGSRPVPSITRMEYFIDTDPGYGHAAPINITPASDISMLVVNADIANVTAGAHKIGIRSMDANGAWGLDNSFIFYTGNNWIGVTSTDWFTASNWSKGVVPTVADPVAIPAGTPFSPAIGNGTTGHCKSIRVEPTAVITIATGGNLKVGL